MRYNINDVLDVLSESTIESLYNNYPELFTEEKDVKESTSEVSDDKNILSRAEDIFNQLKHIQYGSFDKSGKELKGDDIIYSYVQHPDHTLKTKKGMCLDQVELEKYLFDQNGIKYDTYYVSFIDDDGDTPSHVFLVFKYNNKYYWFEHSWGSCRGIHEYDSMNKLFKDVLQKHCEKYIDTGKIVKYTENLVGKEQEYIMNMMEKKSPVYGTKVSKEKDVKESAFENSNDKSDNKPISNKPLTTKIVKQTYNKDNTGYHVTFFDDGKEVGEASVCDTADDKGSNFLYGVEVKSSLRGLGYGTKIVKYMIDKYNIKHLNVAKDNKIAQNLYKKFGFKMNGNVRMNNDEIMWRMTRK